MEHFRLYGLILVLLVLSSVICRAEDSICVHDIDSIFRNKILVTADPYKVGITDFVTYTITGGTNARFWMQDSYTYICICLPSKNDLVTTSKITNLKRVNFTYGPVDQDYLAGVYPTMQIMVSQDSIDWTDLSSSAVHGKASAEILLPSAGDYYLRIKNTGTGSSKPIYIRTFEYKTQHCNCYQYQP